jgi:predicted TIM-barrel fold metal-dependent hydrolase
MDRVGIQGAWVSHLAAVFWRDPGQGNQWLYRVAAAAPRLRPVPAVHPGMPGWRKLIEEAVRHGVPAIRCDPTFYGLAPAGPEMRALAGAAVEHGLPLMAAVRFEDGRQRHPNDVAAELPPWAVRHLIRAEPELRLLVTHASREFIEEVHWGSTPEEAQRIWWDIGWVWGPPEDHLQTLLSTIGLDRFVFGTGQPLRIPENAVAKLDLLDCTAEARRAIESGNLRRLVATKGS